MKKLFSLVLSLLLAASALSFTFGASAAVDPIVFTGEEFAKYGDKLSDPEKNITYPASAAADGSLRLVFAKSTKIAKMQFGQTTFGKEVDKSVYKFVKVRYKYHFKSPDQEFKAMLREGYSGKSTNHELFPLQRGNDKWFDDIAEITWGVSEEPNVFTFHPIRDGGSASAGDVFYIDYIAFFATREDAEKFALNDKTYTEPPLVESFETEEVSSVSTDPNASPVVLEGKPMFVKPYRTTYEESISGDRTYMHILPDDSTEPTAVPKCDNFGQMDVDLKVYKYIKLCYRTNLDLSFQLVWQMVQSENKSLKFYPKSNDEWESVILTMGVDTGSLTQFHFWPFGNNSAASVNGYETDVEYIAFFPTLDSAKAFRADTSGKVYIDSEATQKAPKEEIVVEEREVTVVADGAPIILTGKALANTPYRCTYEVREEDGVTFLHVEPDVSLDLVPKVDNYSMGALLNTYKYMKIGYRTNCDAEKPLIYMAQRDLKKSYEFTPAQKDTWLDVTFALDAPADIEKLIQAHFWVFGDRPANQCAGLYTDIRYVAFFATKAEADAYGNEGLSDTEVETAEHTSYMKGYDNGDGTMSFGPGGNMTRAEACTLVARLAAGSDEKVPADGATAFSDTAGEWYTKYIAYLESLGFLSAYSGEFFPNQPITRAEFVELVYKLGLVSPTSDAIAFTDVDASHARYETIRASAAAGLVNGYDNGDGTFSFKPDNTITRAEVVTVINRALGRIVKDMTIPFGAKVAPFTDVDSSHWAYGQIAEATTDHLAYDSAPTKILPYELWATLQLKTGEEALAKEKEVEALALERKNAIINSPSVDPGLTGVTYYVSSIHGDDNNDGLSPEKPFATITRLNTILFKPGDKVLLERGSVFRGHFTAKVNGWYGAYGEGEKPCLYASPRNGAVEGAWTQTPENANIWKYSEPFGDDVGTIVFNGGEEVAIKKCKPNKSNGIEYVKQNFDFWYNQLDRCVYLYLDKGNPATLYHDIEFNERGNIFSVKTNNVTFDNLCFMYGGSHGIGCGGVSDVHVQNCVFGYIGGAMQNDEARFGNGVEFWAPSQDCSIKNCYVYQVYDAGITFQMKGTSNETCTFNRVYFEDNLIEDCTYDIEYFLRQDNSEGDYIANTALRNNILRTSGGWGSIQRPERGVAACIKGWDSENRSSNFVIENNILDCGCDMLIHIGSMAGANFLPIMRGNTYIQTEGGRFGRWNNNEIAFNDSLNYLMVLGSCENTSELYAIPAK